MNIQVERLSAVIDAVATQGFYPNLLAWLEGFFAFDSAIVYAFEPRPGATLPDQNRARKQ
jgi:hypothetical protein